MEGNFAELVDGAAQHLGLNDYQLSAAIGLLEGNRVYSPKQVHRLRAGEVRHPDPELVERLVAVLHLDPDEAFAAARVLPHGFKADHFRKLEFFAAPANGVSARKVALPVAQELHDDALLRRLGVPPSLAVVVPLAPRRDRRADDRRLRALPDVAA